MMNFDAGYCQVRPIKNESKDTGQFAVVLGHSTLINNGPPQTNSLLYMDYCYFGNRLQGTGEKLPSKLVPTAIGWSETTRTVVDTLVWSRPGGFV